MKKIVSWNVNGIRAVQKKGFVDILKNFDADIFCLQETKAQKEQLDEKLLKIAGYQSYWHSAEKKGYSGVAAYTKKEPINVIEGIGDKSFDDEGRVQIIEYEDFVLFNCYFPNSQHELLRLDYKLAFNQAIQQRLLDYSSKTRLICGDLNVAHKEIDLKNPQTNHKNPGFCPEERQWMTDFLASGYIDTFRQFNQEAEQYSWWSYRFQARKRNIGWRIDYFCIDEQSKDRLKNAQIHQDILGSDHCPVSLELD